MSDSETHERISQIASHAMATAMAARRGQARMKHGTTFVDRSHISPTGGTVSPEEIKRRRHIQNRTFKERFFGLLNAVLQSDNGDFTRSRPFIATLWVGTGRPSPDQSDEGIKTAMSNFTRVREYIRKVERDEDGEIVRDISGRPIFYDDLEFEQSPVQIFAFKKDMPGTDYSVHIRHLIEHNVNTDQVAINRMHTSSLQEIRSGIEDFVLTQVDEHGNRYKQLILGYYFLFFPSYSGKGGGVDPSEARAQLERDTAYSAKQELEADLQSIPAGSPRQVVLLPNSREEDEATAGVT